MLTLMWAVSALLAALQPAQIGASTTTTPVMVVVWHPQGQDIWAGWDRGEPQDIEALLLGRCNAVMGGGCTVAGVRREGVVAIARKQDGSLWMGTGADGRTAASEVLSACSTPDLDCTVETTLGVSEGRGGRRVRDPESPTGLRLKSGAIAFQSPSVTPRRVWVVGGRETQALAISDVLANCAADGGVGCHVVQHGSGTHFVVYTDDRGDAYSLQGRSLENALLLQARVCAERARICRTEVVVDAQVEDTGVHPISSR